MRRAALCLILLTLPALAGAQWSDDPLANLLIVERPSEQVVPKVAASPAGGCYVGWYDLASGNYDVYLQRLDAAGNAQWPAGGIPVSTEPQNSWVTDWDLIADADGNAVLVFADARGGSDFDIFAYKVAPDGSQLWGDQGVTLSDNDDFEPSPRVAQAADGDCVFVWGRSPDAGDGALMMQRLAPDGTPRFPAGGLAVAGESGESPGFCDLVSDGAGGVIVAWVRDTSTFLSPRHLWAERFGADGGSLWGGPTVVFDQTSLPIAYYPEILADGAGGALLLWHRSVSNLYNSAVQRLDAAGGELWPHNGVLVSTLGGVHHISPTFCHDAATGDLYVFWDERNSAQSAWGIAGQRLDAAGSRLWGDSGRVFLATDGLYKWALRALPAPGGAMLFWIDEPGGFGSDRVRGFRADDTGAWLWGDEPLGVATLPSGKSRLPVALASTGEALLVWEDDRGGTVDLYGQNVRLDGSLGGDPTAAEQAPGARALSAWPNPFNPRVEIGFALERAGDVLLTVHDAAGRRVDTLVAGRLEAGAQRVAWRAPADLPSGVYLARLLTGSGKSTRKLLLLK